jgi:hypothetical protein
VRIWPAIVVPAVVLIAAGCSSATPTAHLSVSAPSTPASASPAPSATAPGYSVPLSRIVADANAASNHTDPPFRLAPAGTKAPMAGSAAEHAVVSGCNEGRGTRVLGATLVTGPATAGSRLYWAVFVDPPGKHVAPYAEGPPKNPTVLNWIGGFVPVKDPGEPFCDYGHAADLPPLPVFRS